MRRRRAFCRSAILGALIGASGAGCSGSHHHAGGAAHASIPRKQTFGHGALATEATRTIEVRMRDDLRFDPDRLVIRRGEVVTFHVVNVGKGPHEFTIGGPESQELHDDQMAVMDMPGMPGMSGMSGMHHDDKFHKKYEANLKKRIAELDRVAAASESVHVLPNEPRDVTWAFTGTEVPVFGCHIPGHWWAGMKGSFSAA